MGPVELPLGQAAAALGHLDQAVEDLQTAASICDTNGARGCAVQARAELAAALTRRQAPGDRDEALAALAAAAREAGQLGMVPFTEWTGQLQAQLTAAPAGDSPLSPRELEVFHQLVNGLRAKDIARLLDISPKTVDTYRASLFRKLNVHDLVGLVKFAIDRGLTTT